MIRTLFVILVISQLLITAPGTASGQTTTPVTSQVAACTVTPRTPEELEALLSDDSVPLPATPLAVQATPSGELQPGISALPDGTPADSTEVEAVVQETFACLAAGDILRYLALFSDEEILRTRSLRGLGLAMATPDLRTPTPSQRDALYQTRGLFHARLLPDGRMAAVSPLGFLGVPELYLFVREGDRWLIDSIVPLTSEYASSGAAETAYTGARFVSSGRDDFVIYGWGLAWGPEWTPVVDPASNLSGYTVLTNGVSFVVVGVPGAGPGSELGACVSPRPRELASDLKGVGMGDAANSLRQGLVPVTAADGSPLHGVEENRAFAVYEPEALPEENVAADGALRVYLECRTMAGGAWVLGITHIATAANLEDEAAKRDALLASLEDGDAAQAPAN
jgi:hypothetical protein